MCGAAHGRGVLCMLRCGAGLASRGVCVCLSAKPRFSCGFGWGQKLMARILKLMARISKSEPLIFSLLPCGYNALKISFHFSALRFYCRSERKNVKTLTMFCNYPTAIGVLPATTGEHVKPESSSPCPPFMRKHKNRDNTNLFFPSSEIVPPDNTTCVPSIAVTLLIFSWISPELPNTPLFFARTI